MGPLSLTHRLFRWVNVVPIAWLAWFQPEAVFVRPVVVDGQWNAETVVAVHEPNELAQQATFGVTDRLALLRLRVATQSSCDYVAGMVGPDTPRQVVPMVWPFRRTTKPCRCELLAYRLSGDAVPLPDLPV